MTNHLHSIPPGPPTNSFHPPPYRSPRPPGPQTVVIDADEFSDSEEAEVGMADGFNSGEVHKPPAIQVRKISICD